MKNYFIATYYKESWSHKFMHHFTKFFHVFLILFAVAIIVGCGKPKITGKVVFSDDKTPLTEGTIMFHKGNEVSRGTIQEDGTYTIGSQSTDDGLAPGKYQIAIKNTQKNLAPPGQAMPVFESVIDRKYEDSQTVNGIVTKIIFY